MCSCSALRYDAVSAAHLSNCNRIEMLFDCQVAMIERERERERRQNGLAGCVWHQYLIVKSRNVSSGLACSQRSACNSASEQPTQQIRIRYSKFNYERQKYNDTTAFSNKQHHRRAHNENANNTTASHHNSIPNAPSSSPGVGVLRSPARSTMIVFASSAVKSRAIGCVCVACLHKRCVSQNFSFCESHLVATLMLSSSSSSGTGGSSVVVVVVVIVVVVVDDEVEENDDDDGSGVMAAGVVDIDDTEAFGGRRGSTGAIEPDICVAEAPPPCETIYTECRRFCSFNEYPCSFQNKQTKKKKKKTYVRFAFESRPKFPV
jgi:hypothetical protein